MPAHAPVPLPTALRNRAAGVLRTAGDRLLRTGDRLVERDQARGPGRPPGGAGRAPHIGVEELMAVARLWGFDQATLHDIERVAAAHPPGTSPWMVRYQRPGAASSASELEELCARRLQLPYVLATSSGTGALEAAYRAVGLGPGDQVIVPRFTFWATAAAALRVGAWPVPCDVDESLSLSADAARAAITPRTRAIVPVHMLGGVADLAPLRRLADDRGLRLVEDAAQAFGARYRGRPVGAFGDAACFSLSSFKYVGLAEAGLVATSDENVFLAAQSYHDTAGAWRGENRYEGERFPGELQVGTNQRMSELVAAPLAAHLRKEPALTATLRGNHAAVLEEVTADRGSRLAPRATNDPQGDVGTHAVLLAGDRDEARTLAARLRAGGIDCTTYGRDLPDWHLSHHWHQLYAPGPSVERSCPFACRHPGPIYDREAEALARSWSVLERVVSIPLSASWSLDDCRRLGRRVAHLARPAGARSPTG